MLVSDDHNPARNGVAGGVERFHGDLVGAYQKRDARDAPVLRAAGVSAVSE